MPHTAASSTSSDPRPAMNSRTRTVWLCLLGAMTSVGALLLALDGQPAANVDGLALVAATPASSSIEAVFNTREPLDRDRWEGIVIYHSGSMQGSAATLSAAHRAKNLHGLGHHFVIGNGSGQDDGELHVGYRWLNQVPGAHAAGPDQDTYNRRHIGICLIGDGDRRPFTDIQMRRLIELIHALQRELDLPPDAVRLGRDISSTSSPGRFFPEATLRRSLAAAAAGL